MNWGHMLFGFSGRINRAKWWLSVLAVVILSVLVSVLGFVLPSDTFLPLILAVASWIITVWISLAAGAKRLHDLNKSGGWLVIFTGGPILLVAAFIAYAGGAAGAAILAGQAPSDADLLRIGGAILIVGLIWLALLIWYLVWFGCLRGTVGANRFGVDPLEGKI